MSPAPNGSKRPFNIDASISSIGIQDDEEDVTKLVGQYMLRVIAMGEGEAFLSEYWSKTDGDFGQSNAEEYFLKNWSGKPAHGRTVFQALSSNYEEEIQKVLDRIFNAVRLPSSTCTKKALQFAATKIHIDDLGMADVSDCKTFFDLVHPINKRQKLYS